MKYVCIDDGAVTELISGREYQSIDFTEGAKLLAALSGSVEFVMKQNNIALFQDQEGAFLTTEGQWKKKKFVIIDCEQSALFTQLRANESLTSFQKLLRFCNKYWSGGVYNRSEKIIQGTTKAIIFPLPYAPASPFRVAIERHPLRSRLKKRQMDDHFLLVYKSGRERADSSTEAPDETIFRKAFERLPQVYRTIARRVKELERMPDEREMASTNLEAAPSSIRPVHRPFKDWMPLISQPQQKFVLANIGTPHRLEGPAGTGKSLALLLRTIRLLREADRGSDPFHALLVTHSEATREAIREALSAIDLDDFQSRSRESSRVSLSVETLASLCAEFLQQSISEAEFVDRDAQDSKILQQMYIEQAIGVVRAEDFQSFKPHLSSDLRALIEDQTDEELSTIFQHEISVLIKGRAGDSYEIYKNCPSLKYGLPIRTDADKGFAFSVFRQYQNQLESANQFDTDDVVISAVGQLDTPIWRRRRAREGYDFIAIDETHLFNINELQVFHHFTRGVGSLPISFTVDRAQAVGDRGWNDVGSFDGLLGVEHPEEETTTVSAIFRSSPDIREFCHAILASGATLFTNFANTMIDTQSAFTAEDERRSLPVKYKEYLDDEAMVEGAFRTAESLRSDTQSSKPEVLITTLSDSLLAKLREYAVESNKAITMLERRGDFLQIKKAEGSGHFVLGHADFVGGLEFNAVVIAGVDKGRVPYEGETSTSNSRSYSVYAAHNRLYVAASRAKYALNLLGVKSRGASDLLTGASQRNLIQGVN